MERRSPLRGCALAARERRGRRIRLPPDDRLEPIVQTGTRDPLPRASSCRRPRRPRQACSTATGSTSTSATATPAPLFGQVDLAVTDRLRLLPGLRFNYDQKDVDFDQQVYGGLQTTDPALIALQLSVLAPQKYQADVDDTNLPARSPRRTGFPRP